MSNHEAAIALQLQISSSEPGNLERIEEAAVALRDELRELGLQAVGVDSTGQAPEGAKSAEVLAVGAILVAVVPEMVKDLVKLAFDWVGRDHSRTIKIRQKDGGPEYELTGAWKADDLANLMRVLARQDKHAGKP